MDLSWLKQDSDLRDELLRRRPEATRRLLDRNVEGQESAGYSPFSGEEAIVLTQGRPVLFVQDDTFQLPDDATDTWRARLEKARNTLQLAIPWVGRVNVRNHPSLDWVGTAWVVADGVVATNRHVAREFAAKTNGGFAFLPSPIPGKTIGARIDFRQEYERPDGDEVKIAQVLYIADDGAPDVGLLALEKSIGKPLALAATVNVNDDVAAIGYPARDSRNPSGDMERIFGVIYDVKRLAPGKITWAKDGSVQHDCTTLGGNSGSAVVSLATGAVVGLHFGGKPLLTNYAVPAPVVAALVEKNRP